MGKGSLKKGWTAAWCALLVLFSVVWTGSAAVSASQADARFGVYVQDEAGIISAQTEETLYLQAKWLYEQTGSAQIGVVTVNDLGGRTLEEFAVARFREMGLGSRERNDGVLLLYVKEENRVRIEVGYGMEGRIPDGKAGAILDQYFVPYRDAGVLDYAFFLTQSALIIEMAAEYGIDASSVIGLRSGGPPSESAPYEDYPGMEGDGFWSALPWPVKVFGIVAIVILLILDFKFTGGAVTYAILNMLARSRGGGGGRGGWGGGRGGGGSSGGGGASR
jgi:uncharacterized protein